MFWNESRIVLYISWHLRNSLECFSVSTEKVGCHAMLKLHSVYWPKMPLKQPSKEVPESWNEKIKIKLTANISLQIIWHASAHFGQWSIRKISGLSWMKINRLPSWFSYTTVNRGSLPKIVQSCMSSRPFWKGHTHHPPSVFIAFVLTPTCFQLGLAFPDHYKPTACSRTIRVDNQTWTRHWDTWPGVTERALRSKSRELASVSHSAHHFVVKRWLSVVYKTLTTSLLNSYRWTLCVKHGH